MQLSPLFLRFQSHIRGLPSTVQDGVVGEPLAEFSGHLRLHIQDDMEDWECLDPLLNRVIGADVKTVDIATFIRCGRLGMDGLFAWLLACVNDLKLSEGLLEGKIERLVEAMVLWCVFIIHNFVVI